MRLSDLASLAGVSTATVSRALAGHNAVSKATRERIQALAQAHDFRPNQLARNLRLRSTGAIGLALPLGHARDQHLTDPFFLTLLGLLADRLVDRGYDILLSRVIPSGEDWLDRMINGGRIDGLMLIGQSDQSEVIERVAARYPPLVIWGAHRPGQRQVTVGSDNVAGGCQAAEHLLARGRRSLMFVGDPKPPEFADRLHGFQRAAIAGGGSVEIVATTMTPDAVRAATAGRLGGGGIPDGIFAGSDVAAIAVLRALAELGIAVPDRTAVIGYDDITLASHTAPPLTTIAQDLEAGADLMVERLFALLAGEEATSAMVQPALVIRSTT